MRLIRISLLALVAGISCSGCSAQRGIVRNEPYRPLRDVEPPPHRQEFSSQSADSDTDHGQPAEPVAPQSPIPQSPGTAPGGSTARVKSVSFAGRSFGTWRTDDGCSPSDQPACTEKACSADTGCLDHSGKPTSCLTRWYRKSSDSVSGLLRGRRRTPACEPAPCTEPERRPLPETVSVEPCESVCSEPDTVCAPQPGCSDTWRESGERLQSRKPCLADSLQDPFVEFDDTAEPANDDHIRYFESIQQQLQAPAPAPAQNVLPQSESAPRSPVPPQPVPVPSPPGVVPAQPTGSESVPADTLPLWPRLQKAQRVSVTSAAQELICRPASRTAAVGGELPQIVPRERF